MCIPPIDKDPVDYFAEIELLNKKLNLNQLSMGMSSDYLKAVQYSSTYLRIDQVSLVKGFNLLNFVLGVINLINFKKSFSFKAIQPAVGL